MFTAIIVVLKARKNEQKILELVLPKEVEGRMEHK